MGITSSYYIIVPLDHPLRDLPPIPYTPSRPHTSPKQAWVSIINLRPYTHSSSNIRSGYPPSFPGIFHRFQVSRTDPRHPFTYTYFTPVNPPVALIALGAVTDISHTESLVRDAPLVEAALLHVNQINPTSTHVGTCTLLVGSSETYYQHAYIYMHVT